MLQETGHAGGVPIASPRGRSVEVPFGRELLFLLKCEQSENTDFKRVTTELSKTLNQR